MLQDNKKSKTKPASSFQSWKGHHAGIRVPNFEEAVAWYCGKLDFRLTQSSELGTTKLGFLSPAGDDDFGIELLANPDGAERPSYQNLGGSHNLMGWHHICFRADDLSASIAALERRGVKIVSAPFDAPAFGIRFAFFSDPWGNLFELFEDIAA
nr:VOC family protein [uncultured Devosia sp.]